MNRTNSIDRNGLADVIDPDREMEERAGSEGLKIPSTIARTDGSREPSTLPASIDGDVGRAIGNLPGSTDASASIPPVSVTTDTVTVEERQRIGIRLMSPDWMTADQLGVWVKLDGGTIEHVDPVSFMVLTSVEVAEELCQGIGTSFDSIWACAGPGIVRVDPAIGEVVARIDVNKAFSQGNLACS